MTTTPRRGRRWGRLVLALAAAAGATVRQLPGLLAVVATFAGVLLLWGLGWALLSVVPFLLVVSYELNSRAGAR